MCASFTLFLSPLAATFGVTLFSMVAAVAVVVGGVSPLLLMLLLLLARRL